MKQMNDLPNKGFDELLAIFIRGNFRESLNHEHIEAFRKLSDEQRQHLLFVIARRYANKPKEYQEIVEIFTDLNIGRPEWYFLPAACRQSVNFSRVPWDRHTNNTPASATTYSPYIKTALHFAVENKSSKEVLEWLIQFGVPVDSICDYHLGQPVGNCDRYDHTPRETALDIAVKMGDVIAFDVLTQHGASVGPILHTTPGGTFNHHSRWKNPYIHPSMIEKLCKAGAELNGYNLTYSCGTGSNACTCTYHEDPALCILLRHTAARLNSRLNGTHRFSESTALVKAVLDLPGLNFRAVVHNAMDSPRMLIEALFSTTYPMNNCSPETLLQSWGLIRQAFRKHLMQRLLAVKESVSGIDINVAHIVTQYELDPLEYASYAYCKSQEEAAKVKAAAQNSTTDANTASSSTQTAYAGKMVSAVSFIATTTSTASSSAVSMAVVPATSSSSVDLAPCTNYPETNAVKFVREVMQNITGLNCKDLLDSLQPETVAPTSTCTGSSSGRSLTFSASACAVSTAAAAAADPSRTTTSSSDAVPTANFNSAANR